MKPLQLALAATLLVGCEPVTAPAFPTDAPPTSFRVNFGGFGYGSHDVMLRGDTLVIVRRVDYRPDSVTTARVIPTRAEWSAFWRASDAAGVRSWAGACTNERIADGGGFELEIAYAGGRVAARGINAYPKRDGTCSTDGGRTPEATAFFAAVSTLIGRSFP